MNLANCRGDGVLETAGGGAGAASGRRLVAGKSAFSGIFGHFPDSRLVILGVEKIIRRVLRLRAGERGHGASQGEGSREGRERRGAGGTGGRTASIKAGGRPCVAGCGLR